MIRADLKIKIPAETKRLLARVSDKRMIFTPFKEEFRNALKDYADFCKKLFEEGVKVKREKYLRLRRAMEAVGPYVRGNTISGSYSYKRPLESVKAEGTMIPLISILENGYRAFSYAQTRVMAIPWRKITPWRSIYGGGELTEKEKKERIILTRYFTKQKYEGIHMFEQTNSAISSELPGRIEKILIGILGKGEVVLSER